MFICSSQRDTIFSVLDTGCKYKNGLIITKKTTEQINIEIRSIRTFLSNPFKKKKYTNKAKIEKRTAPPFNLTDTAPPADKPIKNASNLLSPSNLK
jgi:ABC-type lipoprotein release transport system permease subunit